MLFKKGYVLLHLQIQRYFAEGFCLPADLSAKALASAEALAKEGRFLD